MTMSDKKAQVYTIIIIVTNKSDVRRSMEMYLLHWCDLYDTSELR
jgi:hypothetical protein